LFEKFTVIGYKMSGKKQNTSSICSEPEMEHTLKFNTVSKSIFELFLNTAA